MNGWIVLAVVLVVSNAVTAMAVAYAISKANLVEARLQQEIDNRRRAKQGLPEDPFRIELK